MKLTRSLQLTVTGDTDTAKLFDQALGRAEDALIVVENSGVRKVAANATGVSIPMGGVTTASFMMLATDKDIVVRLNGGMESIAIKASTAVPAPRAVLYLEGAITSVVVDNPGAADATVLYAFSGV